MIKVYSTPSCPDCAYLEPQLEGREEFEGIDIGAHVKNLKDFLRLRDHSPAFAQAKRLGLAGLPCFVREDGSVTLSPEEVGLRPHPEEEAPACSLGGPGC